MQTQEHREAKPITIPELVRKFGEESAIAVIETVYNSFCNGEFSIIDSRTGRFEDYAIVRELEIR